MLPKLSILIGLLLLFGCDQDPLDYNKQASFDDLHASMARYAASIDSRQVNWDSIGSVYRSAVSEEMTEAAFFGVVSDLLLTLRDPHVQLHAPFESMYTVERLGYVKNYDEFVTSTYLSEVIAHNSIIRSAFVNDTIGYLFCADFKGDVATSNEIYEAVIDRFSDTRGLIIDLRVNDGGSVYNAQNLLGKFALERQLWHTTQNRTVAGFDDKFEWYIEPDVAYYYPHPVMVLNGRFTISAGERFAIGAQRLSKLTIIGDTTANTQGSVMGREMLNGWTYTLTFERCLSPEGINYGGVGIPPDYYLEAEVAIHNGRDLILEKAIDLF